MGLPALYERIAHWTPSRPPAEFKVTMEAQGLAIDPDLNLTAAQGGSAFFRPITKDTTRNLDRISQSRMQDVGRHLYERNPIAKRLVDRRKSLVLGDGVTIQAEEDEVQKVLDEFWAYNEMDRRLGQDFISRSITGELLIPTAVAPVGGLVDLGFIPAERIKNVQHAKNNVRKRETVELLEEPGIDGGEAKAPKWRVITRDRDPKSPTRGLMVGTKGKLQGGSFKVDAADSKMEGAAFHFIANALGDQTRGISDLLCIADYLDAYELIMFDLVERAALLNTFVMRWIHHDTREEDIRKKVAARGTAVPKAGTVLHTNEKEEIEFLTPSWGGGDATAWSELILGIIATGGGVPKYWLNSQLDPNRASAEEMSRPVLRDVGDTQTEWQQIIEDQCSYAIAMAILTGRLKLPVDKCKFQVIMPAITGEDRTGAATFAQAIVQVMVGMDAAEISDPRTKVELACRLLDALGIELTPEGLEERLEKERIRKEEEQAEQFKVMQAMGMQIDPMTGLPVAPAQEEPGPGEEGAEKAPPAPKGKAPTNG